MPETNKPTPEELLARVNKAERRENRGRLKVFLGFAAGVGKTFEMLNEASRRKQRGQDVVIGWVVTHGRKGTESQLGDLEVVPRKQVEYRGTVFEEMDTEAILVRKPMWVIVDELAHTNVPGSIRGKRWQDIELLLDAKINVLTTMNVQHLESLNDTIADITGVRVRETVPDHILTEAEEVKMVDITARALIHRLERGDIYAADKVPSALENWFREGNLNALREIALREIAQEVDSDVSEYRKDKHITENWATHDRILVCISPSRSSLRLLRRGWRISQRLKGEIVALYVQDKPCTEAHKAILEKDFAMASQLHIPLVKVEGHVADEIIRYARENRITEIVIGHSKRSSLQEFVRGSIINALTKNLRDVDILLVAGEEEN